MGALGLMVRGLGTAGVCLLLWWSLRTPENGILREVTAFGPGVAALVIGGFLALVVAYARDLYRLLAAIPAESRAASPGSVWWMLLIPVNFVEDFFIVRNIGRSLQLCAARGRFPVDRTGSYGRVSGFGWCGLQILSLVPTDFGALAGVLALPLWLWHWRYVRLARASVSSGA